MKKHYYSLILSIFIICGFCTFAQAQAQVIDTAGVTIKGSKIYINSGTTLFLDGTLHNVKNDYPFDVTPEGDVLNNDTIYLAGNISNRILNKPLFSFGGTVNLRYNFPQYFRNDTINFFNLIINKTNNKLTLQRGITIDNQFSLIKGNVDMVQYNIDLLNNGSLLGENFQNNIYSNLGWIIARNRLLSPVNFGDISTLKLGLNPAIDNLGLTTIFRRNKVQDSLVDGSIERIYDVFPNNTGNADIVFNYYDTEWQNLSGPPDETTFKLFNSTQTGIAQSTTDSWKIDTNSVVNAALNFVSASNLLLHNGGSRWTIADSECNTVIPISLPSDPVWFCNGDSVTLDAGSAGNRYKWTNGATTRTIKVKATNIIGTKDTIGVYVYINKGCRSFKSVEVSVFPKPTPLFSTPVSACLGASVLYTNNSTIAGAVALNYIWKFYDNSTSSGTNISKAYASAGTFTAQLVATSPYGCKDSLSKSIIIQPKPVASFNASVSEQCINKIINLTNGSSVVSGAIAQSSWTFGDGFSSALAGLSALNPEMKAYAIEGNYTIKLVVRSSGNCTDSTTKNIKIHPNPVAAFNASGFTSNLPTSFDNTSSISLGYSLTHYWEFRDGSANTSVDKSPLYTYTASGVYKPFLEVTTNKGCVDTLSKTIVISGLPIANFSVSAPNLCTYDVFSFSNLSTIDAGSLSYAWDFGDGTTSTLTHPTKKYTNAGTYTVSLLVTAQSGLTATFSQLLTANPVPNAAFVATSVCQGLVTNFTNTSSISSGTFTNSWDFGDSNVSTVLSPQHSYISVGAYNVKLFLVSDFGCKDTSEVVANVFPVPVANFTVSNGCQGAATGFVNTSSISGGSFTSFWSLGNASTSTQTHPITTYASAGNYLVRLNIDSDNGCSATVQKNVQIFDNPTANFSSSISCTGDPTSFTNLSNINTGTLTYVWDFGIVGTSTGINPSVVFPNANAFSVQLTAISNQNCSKSISKIIDVKPLPNPDFTANAACLGQQTNFINASTIATIPAEAALTYVWKFGNSKTSILANPSQDYVSVGNYNVTLTAASIFGCKKDVVKTISVNALPIVDFTLSNHCLGTNLILSNNSTVSGGTLTYLWNFNDGTSSTDRLPNKIFTIAKTHNVDLSISSSQGCSANANNSVVVYPQANASFTSPSTVCSGAVFSVSDFSTISTGTFSRLWDFGGQATSSISNPTYTFNQSGTYTILLKTESNRGCVKTVSSTITVSPSPVVDFSIAPNVGNGLIFTNITTISGGGSLVYLWSFGDGNNSNAFSPQHTYTFNGNYDVTLNATAANGCSDFKTKAVKAPYNNIADFDISGGLCLGSVFSFTDASIFSDNNLSYSWNFGDGNVSTLKNPNNTYLLAGTYQVTLVVTPSTGASVTKIKQVTVYDAPQTNFNISNGCVGNVINFVNTSIDKTNISFQWSLGDGSQANSINASRTYSNSGIYPVQLKATSLQGCTTLVSKNATIYDLPVVDFGDSISTCGTTYPLDAGNAGASYVWSNGANTQTITVSSTGLYNVQITNSNSCSASNSVYVAINEPFAVNLGADATLCESYKIDAGSPGGSYLWSNGATSRFLTVTASGTYSVSVIDPNGCTSSDNISLVILPKPMVDLGIDRAVCANINTILDAQNAGDNFAWSNGQTSQTIALSQSGIYHVDVTNGAGCTTSDAVTITVLSAPTVSLGVDTALCESNFPYLLSVSNSSATYLWSDGSTATSILATTTGLVWVNSTATNGCQSRDSIQLASKTNPIVNLGADKGFCKGDSLILDAQDSGGSFAWSNGKNSQTIKIASAGKYSVLVALVNGCSASDEINISENPLPFVSLGDTLKRCDNQLPLSIQAAGGYSYLWNTGANSQTIQVSSLGGYTLTVTDANLCSFVDSVFVKINPSPNVYLGADTTFCQGNSFSLNALNVGANYLWANGETTQIINVSIGGAYQVQVTNSFGCNSSDDIIVSANIKPNVNLGTDRTLCAGASATLNAGNLGSAYIWSDGTTNQTIQATIDGRYEVTVIGTNGCQSSDDVYVNIVNAPLQNFGNDIASCIVPVLDAGNAGSSYLWSTNAASRQITANNTGTYIVQITNGNNCIIRDTIDVTVYPKPLVNIGNDTSICNLQSVEFDAQNFGSSYFWSNNTIDRTLKVSQQGVYKVTVTNNFQCVASDSVRVIVKAIPAFSFGADKNICQGTNVLLSTALDVGTTFLWSTGSTSNTLNVNTSNTYWLKATAVNGCQFSDTVNINVKPYPVVNIGNDTVVCGSIVLDAKNIGSTYTWSDNVSTQTNTANRNNTYWVEVTSAFGCASADTIKITVKDAPLVNLGPDIVACNGDNISLFANTNANKFKWNTGDTLANINVSSSGNYELKATNLNGCTSKDQVLVSFFDKPIVSLKTEYPICGTKPLVIDAANPGATYLWTSTNGYTSTQQKASITEDGIYILKVTNSFGCTSKDTVKANKNDFSLVAEFLATSNVKSGDTVKMINLSYPGKFQSKWDFGDGIVSEEIDPTHVYFISGIIPATLTVSNGVCSDSKTKKLSIAPRREIVVKDSTIQSVFISSIVYPNPNDGRFMLEVVLSEIQNIAVEFYSLQGNLIELRQLSANQNYHFVFDRPDLATGTYFIRVTAKDEQKFIKVLITNQ